MKKILKMEIEKQSVEIAGLTKSVTSVDTNST